MKKVFIVVLILAALVLGGSFYMYRFTFGEFRSSASSIEDIPDVPHYNEHREEIVKYIEKVEATPYEEVHVKADDENDLFGRYYEAKQGAPVQIMFHGYHASPIRNYCKILAETLESGFNVILVDQRAHGKSEGKCLSFGILERYDCAKWAWYASERFGANTKIILYGISMGAATVMMASDLPLPSNVVGIIADCGYSSPKEIIVKQAKDRHLPVFPLYQLTWLGAKLWGHFDLTSSSPAQELQHTNIPILIIHGDNDGFVPCSMSYTNYESCSSSNKHLLIVPGAEHTLSCFVDWDAYKKAVTDFEKTIL